MLWQRAVSLIMLIKRPSDIRSWEISDKAAYLNRKRNASYPAMSAR